MGMTCVSSAPAKRWTIWRRSTRMRLWKGYWDDDNLADRRKVIPTVGLPTANLLTRQIKEISVEELHNRLKALKTKLDHIRGRL